MSAEVQAAMERARVDTALRAERDAAVEQRTLAEQKVARVRSALVDAANRLVGLGELTPLGAETLLDVLTAALADPEAQVTK